MIGRFANRLKQFWRREDGVSSIEFVILFPIYISVFGSAFEAGLLNTRYAMLERAVDLAVRDLRLGVDPTPTHAELVSSICNYAGVIPDCDNALHVELENISTTDWTFRTGAVQCVDRDENIKPVVNFTGGGLNALMLVTVCAAIEPMVPISALGMKLPKINSTDYALVAMSAFVNEP